MLRKTAIEELARDAIAYAREIIPNCPVEPMEFEENKAVVDELLKKYEPLTILHNKVKKLNEDNTQFESNPFLAMVDSTNLMSQKFSLGNCGELSFLVIEYISNQNMKRSAEDQTYAELFNLANGNHQFVVINRKQESDERKPEEWGEDCYICDPWTQEYYPARDYQHHLKTLKEDKDQNGVVIAIGAAKPSKYSLEYYDINTTMFQAKESKEYHQKMLKIYNKSLDRLQNKNNKIRTEVETLATQISAEKLKGITQYLDEVDIQIERLREQKEVPGLVYRELTQLLRNNLKPINIWHELIKKEIKKIKESIKMGLPPVHPVKDLKTQPSVPLEKPDIQKPKTTFREKIYGLFCHSSKHKPSKPSQPENIIPSIKKG